MCLWINIFSSWAILSPWWILKSMCNNTILYQNICLWNNFHSWETLLPWWLYWKEFTSAVRVSVYQLVEQDLSKGAHISLLSEWPSYIAYLQYRWYMKRSILCYFYTDSIVDTVAGGTVFNTHSFTINRFMFFIHSYKLSWQSKDLFFWDGDSIELFKSNNRSE